MMEVLFIALLLFFLPSNQQQKELFVSVASLFSSFVLSEVCSVLRSGPTRFCTTDVFFCFFFNLYFPLQNKISADVQFIVRDVN